jgi:hypothetical protein
MSTVLDFITILLYDGLGNLVSYLTAHAPRFNIRLGKKQFLVIGISLTAKFSTSVVSENLLFTGVDRPAALLDDRWRIYGTQTYTHRCFCQSFSYNKGEY